MFYTEGQAIVKLFKQRYLVDSLRSSFRKFYGRYKILFSNMKSPSYEC